MVEVKNLLGSIVFDDVERRLVRQEKVCFWGRETLPGLVRGAAPDEPVDGGWRPIEVGIDSFEPRGVSQRPWPDDLTILYWWRPTFWQREPDKRQFKAARAGGRIVSDWKLVRSAGLSMIGQPPAVTPRVL